MFSSSTPSEDIALTLHYGRAIGAATVGPRDGAPVVGRSDPRPGALLRHTPAAHRDIFRKRVRLRMRTVLEKGREKHA
jgi:hypothetical protein